MALAVSEGLLHAFCVSVRRICDCDSLRHEPRGAGYRRYISCSLWLRTFNRTPSQETMRLSQFNVSVPLPERNEVFLMNTFSDAQLLVTPDVTALLDRIARGEVCTPDEHETVESLVE